MRVINLILACAAALGVAAPAFADDANLAGNWNLTITSPQGTRTPALALTQSGGQITGTYKSQRGEVPLTGQITGNQFKLTVKVSNAQGQEITLEYVGTIDGDMLAGMLGMGQLGKLAFVGKRAP